MTVLYQGGLKAKKKFKNLRWRVPSKPGRVDTFDKLIQHILTFHATPVMETLSQHMSPKGIRHLLPSHQLNNIYIPLLNSPQID